MEVIAGLQRRVTALKQDRSVGHLFVRQAAANVVQAENFVKKATEEWRLITEEANMLTPQMAAAAREKELAEQALTSVLLETEKTATQYEYTLEYVRNISHSRMTVVETRVLDTIGAALKALENSKDLVKQKKFALSNLQYVGSLVSVAENATKIMKKHLETSVESEEEYSDEEHDYGVEEQSSVVRIDGDSNVDDLARPSRYEKGEIEMMTSMQLRAERKLRQSFAALSALEKDYQYAKSFLIFETDRSKALLSQVGRCIEKAEAAVAIAEWRHDTLRGVAPPKFLHAVEEAVSRVENLEKIIEDMYKINRDDEMRLHEKSFPLVEEYTDKNNGRTDAFHVVNNNRRVLRGLIPSLHAREARIAARHRQASTIVAEEMQADKMLRIGPTPSKQHIHSHNNRVEVVEKHRQDGNRSQSRLAQVHGAEDGGDVVTGGSALPVQRADGMVTSKETLEQRVLEDAERAYKEMEARLKEQDVITANQKNDIRIAQLIKREEESKALRDAEHVVKRRKVKFARAQGNWHRFKDTMMDQLRVTWHRLQKSQRILRRIKRDRDGMANEDVVSTRLREVENATNALIEAGFQSIWQKQGENLDRETALKAAFRAINTDNELGVEDTLTLGVLDCTDLPTERLSSRQGNEHDYPEVALSQMFECALKRRHLGSPDGEPVQYGVRLIPFRCNQGELPTRPQRTRFDGFILTSSIGPFCGITEQGKQGGPRWQKSLRAFLREIMNENLRILALGNGHLFLASCFQEHEVVPYYPLPPMDVQNAWSPKKQRLKTARAWQCGLFASRSMNHELSEFFQQHESLSSTVSLPYARDAILTKLPMGFEELLRSHTTNTDGNSDDEITPSIDGMYVGKQVLSFQCIPDIEPTLLRRRLFEIVNDTQDGNNFQMRDVSAPIVPSRLDLSKPSHADFVADLALSFLLLPVDEICTHANDTTLSVSDDLSLAANIVLKRSQEIVSSAITVASRNVSTASTSTEEIPKKHVDEEYVVNEEVKQDSTKEIETDHSPLRISKMLQNFLPSDSHPVFRHYTTSPQVIVCGHTAMETMEELLAHRSREQHNMAQCDSIVVGVVPSREGTLLVLPSPVVSAVTNFDSVHTPVVDDKLDGILRNRVDNDANRVLSSFDDAMDYPGNTSFWMDQVSETTSMATRVDRKNYWVHDLPLEKHKSLLANRPSRWKRKEGRVMNMAGPSPIYTLAEFLEKLKGAKGSSKKKRERFSLWLVPIASSSYRALNYDLSKLFFEQAYSLTEEYGIKATVASFDVDLIKTMRSTCVHWRFIQMLSNKTLEQRGIRPGANHKHLRVFMREVSLHADGICVKKEMVLRRPGQEPARSIIQIKHVPAAVQQMPHLVQCARAANLSIFVRCFSSNQALLHPIYRGSPALEYARFFALGIDGVISQHASLASRARYIHTCQLNILAGNKGVDSPRETYARHRQQIEKKRIMVEKKLQESNAEPPDLTIFDRAVGDREERKKSGGIWAPLPLKEPSTGPQTTAAYTSTAILKRPPPKRRERVPRSTKIDAPRPPSTEAPKWRPMSNNANRNKSVYRRGIDRISQRNNRYYDTSLKAKEKLPMPKKILKESYDLWTTLNV
jgi:hypothetical protein